MRPSVEKWDALKWALRPGNGLVEVAEASGRAESRDEAVGREIEAESGLASPQCAVVAP